MKHRSFFRVLDRLDTWVILHSDPETVRITKPPTSIGVYASHYQLRKEKGPWTSFRVYLPLDVPPPVGPELGSPHRGLEGVVFCGYPLNTFYSRRSRLGSGGLIFRGSSPGSLNIKIFLVHIWNPLRSTLCDLSYIVRRSSLMNPNVGTRWWRITTVTYRGVVGVIEVDVLLPGRTTGTRFWDSLQGVLPSRSRYLRVGGRPYLPRHHESLCFTVGRENRNPVFPGTLKRDLG